MIMRVVAIGFLAALAAPAAIAADDYLSRTQLGDAELVKYWQIKLDLAPEQQITRSYLVDDQIYACTNDGYAYAIHAQTGAVRWLQRINRSGYPVPRPCHADGKTVFVTPSEIYVLNKLFGDPVAKRRLHYPGGSAAATDGVRVFCGGINRRMYAFGLSDLFEDWKVLTEGPITSTPTVFREYLFFASEDGRVYSCLAADKKYQWRAETYAPITANLVATDDGVFVASRDNSLYLFDIAFGQTRWRARLSGPLYEPPIVTETTAYQYCPEDGVVAINIDVIDADKRILWKLAEARQALTQDDETVYMLSRDSRVLLVDKETGAVGKTIDAPGFTMPMPAPTTQTIYLASPDGRVFCARPVDAPYVRPEQVRAALRKPPADDGPEVASIDDDDDVATPTTPDIDDIRRPRPVVGGKSKVSKNFDKDRNP